MAHLAKSRQDGSESGINVADHPQLPSLNLLDYTRILEDQIEDLTGKLVYSEKTVARLEQRIQTAIKHINDIWKLLFPGLQSNSSSSERACHALWMIQNLLKWRETVQETASHVRNLLQSTLDQSEQVHQWDRETAETKISELSVQLGRLMSEEIDQSEQEDAKASLCFAFEERLLLREAVIEDKDAEIEELRSYFRRKNRSSKSDTATAIPDPRRPSTSQGIATSDSHQAMIQPETPQRFSLSSIRPKHKTWLLHSKEESRMVLESFLRMKENLKETSNGDLTKEPEHLVSSHQPEITNFFPNAQVIGGPKTKTETQSCPPSPLTKTAEAKTTPIDAQTVTNEVPTARVSSDTKVMTTPIKAQTVTNELSPAGLSRDTEPVITPIETQTVTSGLATAGTSSGIGPYLRLVQPKTDVNGDMADDAAINSASYLAEAKSVFTSFKSSSYTSEHKSKSIASEPIINTIAAKSSPVPGGPTNITNQALSDLANNKSPKSTENATSSKTFKSTRMNPSGDKEVKAYALRPKSHGNWIESKRDWTFVKKDGRGYYVLKAKKQEEN